jgi:TfoX/Sxy family transcriptional regulator of competence genes
MAYNEQLGERIAEKLSSLNIAFEEKKMFGGIAFMIRDKMCIGVSKDMLMLRVMEDKYEAQLEKPHVEPMQFTGKTMKGFLFIHELAYKKDKDLLYWINLGLEFGEKGVLKVKKKKGEA